MIFSFNVSSTHTNDFGFEIPSSDLSSTNFMISGVHMALQVVGILNDLSVLTAENAAKVGVIGARAERKAVEVKNAARAQGLVLLQVTIRLGEKENIDRKRTRKPSLEVLPSE